jgi:hypothetical protein
VSDLVPEKTLLPVGTFNESLRQLAPVCGWFTEGFDTRSEGGQGAVPTRWRHKAIEKAGDFAVSHLTDKAFTLAKVCFQRKSGY